MVQQLEEALAEDAPVVRKNGKDSAAIGYEPAKSSSKPFSREVMVALIGAVSVVIASLISLIPSLLAHADSAVPAVVSSGAATAAPTAAAVVAPNIAGIWQGEWTNKGVDGEAYTFVMDLYVGAGNTINGSIIWTLKSVSSTDYDAKLNLSGTEYVSGIYDPATRTASLQGQSEDDPHEIVTLDTYRITLSDDGTAFQGESAFNNWRGTLSATRSR